MTPLPRGPFDLALMDPPWAFLTYQGNKVPQRAEEQHYNTMTFEQLKAMPLTDVMAKNSAIVMWVVGSHLKQAFELGEALGYTFKTDLLVWRKPVIGMGYYTRKETEQAWLFTRGKPLTRVSKGVRQVIDAPRREHSRKPDEQYDRIEELFGELRYLELFARYPHPGWTQWGNEAPGISNKLAEVSETVSKMMEAIRG